MIYSAPLLASDESAVLEMIREQWIRLHWMLRDKPARWTGLLRRSALARGIRGSNSIEGYTVSDDDAAAAVEGDQPYDAKVEAPSWLAVTGYGDAMTHALRQGSDPDARIDTTLIRSLHFMMLRHEPAKHPGSWRPGPIYVQDDRKDKRVYEGPNRKLVGQLMEELVDSIKTPTNLADESPLVAASIAHLNLAMIHPFSDGNGRMARCLQTLVLARVGVVDPVFCSVEEWLGVTSNTDEYYEILAKVGAGSWNPNRDARAWIRFMLKAHYQQAATFERRQQEVGGLFAEIEDELSTLGFDDRASAPLVEAALGRAIRNSRYRSHADVNQMTASRDLKALVEAGLLVRSGKGRGSAYGASEKLQRIRDRNRVDKEIADPFNL